MKSLTITKRLNRGGSISFCVDEGINPANKKRRRKFFKTRREAEEYAARFRQSRRRLGNLAFQLTPRQSIEAAEAFEQLSGVGATLREAVQYFLRHAKPKGGERLAKDVVTELLESKRRSGKRESYQKALRWAFDKFNARFGETLVHEIRRANVEDWLHSQVLAPISRRNHLRDLGILFRFAVSRGYCAENIIKDIEKPAVIDSPVEILSVSQAMMLLMVARAMNGQKTERGKLSNLVPFVAIGLFAGLRSSELRQLDWSEINLGRRVIEVKAEKSKTSRRRLVNISDNLAAWLEPYQQTEGPVVGKGWRDHFQQVVKVAELEEWPRNALRHSFGSYHLAFHEDAAKTTQESNGWSE